MFHEPENGYATTCSKDSQDNHINEPRKIFDFGIGALVSLQETHGQFLQERRQDLHSQGLCQHWVIAERVEGLDEVFRKAEIACFSNIVGTFEYMRHLESDRLDEALGMFCQLPELSILGTTDGNFENLLDLLQSFHAARRIAAEDAGYCNAHVISKGRIDVLNGLVAGIFSRPSVLLQGRYRW